MNKKKIAIIVGSIILTIGVITFVGFTSYVSGRDSMKKEIYEKVVQEKETTLENEEYKIGDDLIAAPLIIKLNKLTRTTEGKIKPSQGNEYIKLDMNIFSSKRDAIIVSAETMFRFLDKSENYIFPTFKITPKGNLTGTIKDNSELSGELIFEVPKDDKDLKLQFIPPNGDETKIINID